MNKRILFSVIGVLLFSAACHYKKEQAPDQCRELEQLLASGIKAGDENEFATAEPVLRQTAQKVLNIGCRPELWAQCRVEMARIIRRSDRENGAFRAIDTMLLDLKQAQNNWPELAGRFYFHIAYAYRTQEDFWNALRYYEKARQVHETGTLPATTNSGRFLYKPLANIYTRLGESEKAVQVLRIALDSCRQQQDTIGISEVYADLGRAYLDIGQLDSANQQFRQGYSHALQHPNPNAGQQSRLCSHILSNQAQTLYLLGDPDSAKTLARQAIELEEENPDALMTLAEVARAQAQYDSADALYANAEQIYEQDGLPLNRERSKVLLDRARLLLQRPGKPDFEAALAFCQRALRHVLPAFRSAGTRQNPPERLFYPENTILEALDLKSHILWNAYQAAPAPRLLDEADSTAALALAINDTLTAIYGFESSKLYSLENTRNLHERYLQILFERHTRWADAGAAERIAAFLEKSRALLLRQKLAGEYALQVAPIPPDLRRQEEDLRRELIYLKNERAAAEAEEEPDAETIARFQSDIFRVQEARQLLMDSLKSAFPEYFEARYTRPAATLSDIRAMLTNDNSLFAEYFYNTETGALYALGITRKRVQLARTSLAPANLEAFLTFVQDENLGLRQEGDPAFEQQFVHEARMLYDTLLAPLMGQMPPRELIVSPDGPLGSLPFDLLLPREPGAAEQSFRRMPYLLRQTRVRFAASATVLREARALAGHANGKGYFGTAPAYRPDGFFAPVQFGKDCVRKMAGLFQGQLLLGSRATRERFCTDAPEFQVLHFYGHGSANGNRPELSYLAFAGGKNRQKASGDNHTLAATAQLPAEEASRVLFAHEISLLRLYAGLVVLSACETGVGRAAGSEGIFSLARAFQDAGCPSAAMTLWSVDDAATARLTEDFLQNIRAGQAKDLALQQAKLAFLDKYDGSVIPFYWSGMVLSGDAAPLPVQTNGCQFVIANETVKCTELLVMIALLALAGALIGAIFRR